jgi:formylglycine-generating enzyme
MNKYALIASIVGALLLAFATILYLYPSDNKGGLLSCCMGNTRDQLMQNSRATSQSGNLQHMVVPDVDVPEGMVLVPGGLARIGSNQGLPTERPEFTTTVEPFFMDKNLVTVSDFRAFVAATGYKTYSEEVGDGIIFDFDEGRWIIEPGVYWEYPLGTAHAKAPDDHPVTLLTYYDAEAYLQWAGKRLPTEIEWEHAARGVTNRQQPYAWGSELMVDGAYMANTWNGVFPVRNVADDGYYMTSPVGAFAITELGLSDMGGNVWEWTSSWLRSYRDRDTEYTPGPASEKVLRGGSFMCHVSYCHGYRVSARSNTPPDNNMFHIGFRGVKDLP